MTSANESQINNFSEISKSYRKVSTKAGYEDNDHFHAIKNNNPTIDWHKKFQAITNAYIEPNVKNVIWRMIAGKLYLGNIAHCYLNSINSGLAQTQKGRFTSPRLTVDNDILLYQKVFHREIGGLSRHRSSVEAGDPIGFGLSSSPGQSRPSFFGYTCEGRSPVDIHFRFTHQSHSGDFFIAVLVSPLNSGQSCQGFEQV